MLCSYNRAVQQSNVTGGSPRRVPCLSCGQQPWWIEPYSSTWVPKLTEYTTSTSWCTRKREYSPMPKGSTAKWCGGEGCGGGTFTAAISQPRVFTKIATTTQSKDNTAFLLRDSSLYNNTSNSHGALWNADLIHVWRYSKFAVTNSLMLRVCSCICMSRYTNSLTCWCPAHIRVRSRSSRKKRITPRPYRTVSKYHHQSLPLPPPTAYLL